MILISVWTFVGGLWIGGTIGSAAAWILIAIILRRTRAMRARAAVQEWIRGQRQLASAYAVADSAMKVFTEEDKKIPLIKTWSSDESWKNPDGSIEGIKKPVDQQNPPATIYGSNDPSNHRGKTSNGKHKKTIPANHKKKKR